LNVVAVLRLIAVSADFFESGLVAHGHLVTNQVALVDDLAFTAGGA
jgi:hypothetical protein